MTTAPDLREADYRDTLLALLPPGRAWPRDPGSVQVRFWSAIAAGLAALHRRALDLLELEADPARATETLADWERAFGLPDECTPAGQATAQRRAALLAKIRALGGQSRAYFVAVAAELGYAITITEFRPPRAGIMRAGDPVCGEPWVFAWRVNMPDDLVVRAFAAGGSVAGDPLRSWDASPLECVLGRLKPARTFLFFQYGG